MKQIVNGSPLKSFKSLYPTLNYLTGVPTAEAIEYQLATNGYCLFRETGLHTIDDLVDNNVPEAIFSSHLIEPRINYLNKLGRSMFMNYQQGTDDRHNYGSNILDVSSNAPNTNYIKHHCELAYTDTFPRIITFICLNTDSFEAGYTPISNIIDIEKNFDPKIRDKLLLHGIKYLRQLWDSNDGGLYGKTWRAMLNVETKNEAEKVCESLGYDYYWQSNGSLRLEYTRPAFIECNERNKLSFANSIIGMHGSNIDNVPEWVSIPYDDRPYHAKYGNNEDFTNEELLYFDYIHSEYEILFKWNIGDILILDNLNWSHARYPYDGDRKIVTMMGLPLHRIFDINNKQHQIGYSQCQYETNFKEYLRDAKQAKENAKIPL